MKYFLVLVISLALIISSCKKDSLGDVPANKDGASISANRLYNIPNAHCLPTRLVDDGFGYAVDIFYNEAGNPDSLSFDGFPAAYQYDSKGRLMKAIFGPSVYGDNRSYFDYVYKYETFLPSVLKYYSPLNGGLLVTLSFHYNHKGQMVKIENANARNPQFNSAEYYEYDSKDNVVKVTKQGENGGTIYDTSFIEHEVLQYDNKHNFMGGNQWFKYIFFYTQLHDYEFMMFSKNNVTEWLWRPEAYSFYFPDAYYLNCSFDYNNEGFANKVNIKLYDFLGSENYFEFSRTSSSTCDSHGNQLQPSPRKNSRLPGKSNDQIPYSTVRQ